MSFIKVFLELSISEYFIVAVKADEEGFIGFVIIEDVTLFNHLGTSWASSPSTWEQSHCLMNIKPRQYIKLIYLSSHRVPRSGQI